MRFLCTCLVVTFCLSHLAHNLLGDSYRIIKPPGFDIQGCRVPSTDGVAELSIIDCSARLKGPFKKSDGYVFVKLEKDPCYVPVVVNAAILSALGEGGILLGTNTFIFANTNDNFIALTTSATPTELVKFGQKQKAFLKEEIAGLKEFRNDVNITYSIDTSLKGVMVIEDVSTKKRVEKPIQFEESLNLDKFHVFVPPSPPILIQPNSQQPQL